MNEDKQKMTEKLKHAEEIIEALPDETDVLGVTLDVHGTRSYIQVSGSDPDIRQLSIGGEPRLCYTTANAWEWSRECDGIDLIQLVVADTLADEQKEAAVRR